MKSVCSQALEWHRDHPDRREFVQAWMLRFARSVDTAKQWATVQRVHTWFHDHADFRGAPRFFNDGDPSAERIAWDLLGGDAGQSWASKAIDAGPDEYASTMETIEALESTFVTYDGDLVDDDGNRVGAVVASARRWDEFGLRREDWADGDVFASFEGRRPEWGGLFCFEEVLTSDNRIITGSGLTWRQLPFTLQDQLQSQMGHDGAVPVGPTITMDRIDPSEVARLTDGNVELPPEGFGVWATGLFDTGEEGAAARRRMEEGTKQGVSVDLTEVELDLPDDPEEAMEILFGNGILRIKSAKIAAATLVAIPAFENARLRIIGDIPDDTDAEALVASGGRLDGLTLTVVAPFTGVFVNRIHNGGDSDTWDLASATEHVSALTASGASRRPPAEWFAPVVYSEPTPVTLGDPDPDNHGLRRIHGHLGVKGSCHIGFADRCVDVPMGLDYDSFQGSRAAGTVTCADGSKVKAGPIVMSAEHAAIRDARGRIVPAGEAIDHYAHTGCLVAQGRCYEDAHGVQVQGWVLPDVTDEQLARLDACDLSPDWRGRATARGGRGVVALLTVNVSGFNTALVASAGTGSTLYYNGTVTEASPVVVTVTSNGTAELVDDGEPPVDDWQTEQQAAAHRVQLLAALGQPIPQSLADLACATEPVDVTDRKRRVLAALNGDGCDCGCGGGCD